MNWKRYRVIAYLPPRYEVTGLIDSCWIVRVLKGLK